MNMRTAIRRIKKFKPTTPAEFREAGVPLGSLAGIGAFRETVRIKDCDLVVKFPLDGGGGNYHEGRVHTTVELRKIEKLSKFPWMRKYLPKVYYHDRKSGVLVMRYYPRFEYTDAQLNATGELIQELIRRFMGVNIIDIHSENVRGGDRFRAILVDLGY